MNSFLYGRCDFVPRRVRHAQIEHRSAQKNINKICNAVDWSARRRPRTGTSLTCHYFSSTLLPCPMLLELRAGRDEFSLRYLAVLRARPRDLCGALGSVLNAAPWRADIGRRTYPCEQSSKRAFSAKFISPSTSSWGRLKLSMAKAYTETTLTSREEHIPSICRHGVVFKSEVFVWPEK